MRDCACLKCSFHFWGRNIAAVVAHVKGPSLYVSVQWGTVADHADNDRVSRSQIHSLADNDSALHENETARLGDVKPSDPGWSEQLLEPQPSPPWPTAGPLSAMWTSSVRLRRDVASSSHRRRRSLADEMCIASFISAHPPAAAAAACYIWRHCSVATRIGHS